MPRATRLPEHFYQGGRSENDTARPLEECPVHSPRTNALRCTAVLPQVGSMPNMAPRVSL